MKERILKGEMLYLEEEYNDVKWRNGKKIFWAEETKGIKAWVDYYGFHLLTYLERRRSK